MDRNLFLELKKDVQKNINIYLDRVITEKLKWKVKKKIKQSVINFGVQDIVCDEMTEAIFIEIMKGSVRK